MGHPGKGTSHPLSWFWESTVCCGTAVESVDGLKENTKEAWKGLLKCQLFCVKVGRAVSERPHSHTIHRAIKVMAKDWEALHLSAKDNSFEIRHASDVHQCKTLIKAGFASPNQGSGAASFSLATIAKQSAKWTLSRKLQMRVIAREHLCAWTLTSDSLPCGHW